MKKRYINLFQNAASQLQYCANLEDNIKDMRREINTCLRIKDVARVEVLKEMIVLTEKNKEAGLNDFAETMKSLMQGMQQLQQHTQVEEVENPIFQLYQQKVLKTAI